ncbi:MAG: alpha/beta hydrolase [Lysobacteraceae bacterium]
MNEAAEVRLETPRGHFAGLRWGRRGGKPLLALHGWLDNAASFVPMVEAMQASGRLEDLDVVALDLAGHGYSAHRSDGAWYHFVDYGDDIDAALDALGWTSCDLLGHSLGGAIATAFTVAAPERVERLLLIEALGPLPWQAGTAAASLAGARRDRRALAAKKLRVFADPNDAIQARQQANDLSEPVARLLVERGLVAVEGGHAWRSDPRLTLTTPLRASEAQIMEWIEAIDCPVLLIGSDPPSSVLAEEMRQSRVQRLRRAEQVLLPGGHHLHMENPLPVAQSITDYLTQTA